MLKVILALIIAYVLYEFVEHVILPLVWLITKRRKRSPTGETGMIGLEAEVKEWEGRKGKVFVHGELWRAESDAPLKPGDMVLVQSIRGLTLIVKYPDEWANRM